jgi:hypothetical protein
MQRGGVNNDFNTRIHRETEDPFEVNVEEDPTLEAILDGDALLSNGTLMERLEGKAERKVRSKSPYFTLYTDTMAFQFKKEVIIQDCTMVNVNTVMLASQSFEVDDRDPRRVKFGGWQATLADPELAAEIKELRQMLNRMLQSALFNGHMFKVGKDGAELLPLLEFMGRNIEVRF